MTWDFTTASNPLGWAPIQPLSSFGIRNGTLTFTATPQVTIFYSPSISVATTPLQRVEILMSSDTAGAAKVFWAPATSGVYGGFQPGDENDFVLVGDGAFHSYVLPIDTSSATRIYQLRLDVPPGATVATKTVTLASLAAPVGPGVAPSWLFTNGGDALGWMVFQGVADMSVSGGRLIVKTYTNTTMLAPQAHVTNSLEWLSVSGRVTHSSLDSPWMEFGWISTSNNGAPTTVYFPVLADSTDHVYNENVGGGGGWWSTVSQLSIVIPENTTVEIASIQLSTSPQGAADVAVDAVGSATSLVRAGTPFQFSCRVSDRGAQPVQQLSVNLNLPADGSVKVVSSPTVPPSIVNGYPQTLAWTLMAAQSESVSISVSATAPSGGSAQTAATILVNPAVPSLPSSYVPPPVPASSNYDLGVYYFPGWQPYAHWDPIRSFPDRMPALGYYAEGDPRVADWQIKWAVEHGIKFFAVDWYWGGASSTVQGEWPNNFFQGYFSSAYRAYLKFCIAYADDHANGTPGSLTEFLSITQKWITEYFSRAEYYRINQTPVVIIINPQQLESSLGGSAKSALDAARQLARNAGFNGIYFIAGGGTAPSQLSQVAADGYDVLSAYNYSAAGTSDQDQSPYSAMVTGYASTWDSLIASSSLPYIIPISPGFDPKPWLPVMGDTSSLLVRSGSTADQFQQMLKAAKSRIDAGKAPPVVLIEAWNELGEGSYVEPAAGRGFTYLDAIRTVFVDNSPHTDLVPQDVDLPLIESLPSTPLWTFTGSLDLLPWQTAAGPPFYSYNVNISNSHVADSQWTFTTNGTADLMRQSFNISALNYSGLAIRMAVSADAYVTVYWGAADEQGPSASRNLGFTAKAGAAQTYTLACTGNAGWRGMINSLRITIAGLGMRNVDVAIESIEFIPSSTTTTVSVSQSQLQFTWTGGTPAPQTLSVASAPGSSLSWTANANASWLVISPSSGTAPGNVAVSVNPSGLAVGAYKAAITIAPAGAGASPQAIPVTLWVMPATVTPPTPSITGVLNGADFKSEALSPGAWISIFGQNLGQSATATAANTVTLGGASVSVCGLSAALSYNSGPVTTNRSTSWQLNALVPDGVAGQTSCFVVAAVAGLTSQPATIAIASGVMELFGFTSSAEPLPIITHADYSLVGPAATGLTPAKPNETVIAWGTGDCSLPAVTVGGTTASVAFSGRVEPGLCQINFVVPNSLTGGNQLNLSTSPSLYTLWVSP